LGDTAFDLFCEAGIQWDNILQQKGGNRINERIDCDVDYEDDAEAWLEYTLNLFKETRS
jgi:sulfite reductase (NADPH) flavoprotein alpha-component